MSFLNIDTSALPPKFRLKRFLAFAADIIIIVLASLIAYPLFGKPDYAAVVSAREAVNQLPPEQQAAAMLAVFKAFEEAYGLTLLIWFGYEAVTALLLRGRTIGKLIMGLKIIPVNPDRGLPLQCVLLIVRGAVKMLTLYLLNGIPFLICALTVAANRDGRSGFDIFVRTRVKDTRAGAINNKSNS